MFFRVLIITTIILTALELSRPRFVVAHVNLEWFLGLTIITSLFALGRAENPGAHSFGARLILTLALFAGTMVVALRIFADLGRTGLLASIAAAVAVTLITWMEIRRV